MTVARTVQSIVDRLPRGKAFSARIFARCGSDAAVRTALSRLAADGRLVRMAHGVYARPKPHRFFGTSLPSSEEVARTIARSSGEFLAPHGANLARQLGLTTQMPTQEAFYTSGRSRRLGVGRGSVYFQHAPLALIRQAHTPAGHAILALHHIGKRHTTPEILRTLTRHVPIDELRAVEHAPRWMRERFKRFAGASTS